MSDVILGIHSNVAGDANDLTAGHAWISVTENGVTVTYGLWPDDHPRVVNNGAGTDIRVGMEPAVGVANRYYRLTPAQATKLRRLLAQNITWGYSHNCSSWASDVVNEITGDDVDADDYFGIETPRELGRNILILETASPTAVGSPQLLNGQRGRPSSSSSSRGSSSSSSSSW